MRLRTGDGLTKRYIDVLAKRMEVGAQGVETQAQPIEKIVTGLVSMDENDWFEYAFLHEPMRGKLSEDDRRNLYAKASACGKSHAEACIERYGTRSPLELVGSMGLSVDRPIEPTNAGRVLFAEYVVPEKAIHVYMDAVKRGEELLREPGVARAFGEPFSVVDVLLGHELYHVVETECEDGVWTRTYELPLWSVGRLSYKTHISCLSEIAAMAFTRCLNDFDWSPYVLDALLTYGYSPQSATKLYEEMKR